MSLKYLEKAGTSAWNRPGAATSCSIENWNNGTSRRRLFNTMFRAQIGALATKNENSEQVEQLLYIGVIIYINTDIADARTRIRAYRSLRTTCSVHLFHHGLRHTSRGNHA